MIGLKDSIPNGTMYIVQTLQTSQELQAKYSDIES